MNNVFITLVFCGILPATGVLMYIVGSWMPATKEVTAEVQLIAPASHVWATMTAWADQPKWRKGIQRVEVLDSDQFVEYPKRGSPIHFHVLSSAPPRRLELKMSGPVAGNYVAELFEENGITTVLVTECVTVEGPFVRVISKLFFDPENFVKEYLAELKFHVEKNP